MASQRIAYVARVQHGREPECRAVQQHMPVGGLRRLGVTGVDAFVGSGYYLLVLDFHQADFQTFFHRFTADAGMRAFFEKLTPYVVDLPSPAFAPADEFHDTPPARPGVNVTSAALPLAGHAYHWSLDST